MIPDDLLSVADAFYIPTQTEFKEIAGGSGVEVVGENRSRSG